MQNITIPIPAGLNDAELERAIDRAIQTSGLQITLRATLKQHPGCVHWHVKNGREKGTLEITYWPREKRAWFTVRRNRAGKWMTIKIKQIRQVLRDLPRD